MNFHSRWVGFLLAFIFLLVSYFSAMSAEETSNNILSSWHIALTIFSFILFAIILIVSISADE